MDEIMQAATSNTRYVKLYSVCGVLPHKDGLLLLPGISQDRFAVENFKSLRPGAQICLRSGETIVGFVEVATFAVRWDMEQTLLEDAAKLPIALVVHRSELVCDGIELCLPIWQDD